MVPVSLPKRMGAFFIDCVFVIWPIAVLAALDMQNASQNVMHAAAALTGGLVLLNIGLSLHNGQSLGKRAFGLVLVDLEGNPLSMGRRIARSFWTAILLLLSAMGTSLIDFIVCAFRADGRALHDLLAGSKVVIPAPEIEVKNAQQAQSSMVIDNHGNVSGLPAGWTPIEKAPTLFTLNFVGTTMSPGQAVDPDGQIFCGTYMFIFAFIPIFGIRRYLFSREGNNYQFYAQAPVTAGWTCWNLVAPMGFAVSVVAALIINKPT